MMRMLMVVALLAQVVLPVGVYQPQRPPGKLEGQLGALITEHAEQLPTGEWLQMSAVLRRMGSNRYEVDHLTLSTGGKQRIESYVEAIETDRCPDARAEAIERVREAWAPRPPKPPADGSVLAWTVVGNDHCWSECMSQSCGDPCDLRKVTSACLKCVAGVNEAAEKAAKEQAEREARARAALDAVDEVCGEPKPEKPCPAGSMSQRSGGSR